MTQLKLAVLASGKGSNLLRIMEGCASGDIPARIVLVFSDVAGSGAIRVAQERGLATKVLSPDDFSARDEFDAAAADAIEAAGAELLVFAGYMRLVSDAFIARFRGRMINVHPSLLPVFKGAHAVRDAIGYGVKVAGATVHFVTEEMDSGPVIAQEAVAVAEDDDETTLHRRIQEAEHRIYTRAIRLYAEGRLQVEGRRVRVLEESKARETK